MDNNFDNVDLDSDIVQSEWDSCGSNKSDDEWEYVDDKRFDTARGREGVTQTFPISLKNDRSKAAHLPHAFYSEDENELLTQDSFFDGGNQQQTSWNSTEQEHSTTNQQAFAEILENCDYNQSLLPEVQPYDGLRSGAPSEEPANGSRPTNHYAEWERSLQPGESIGAWLDQNLQNTGASGVQSRFTRLSASSPYAPEEPSTEPQATAYLTDRNHEPQNRAHFDQWSEESFGPSPPREGDGPRDYVPGARSGYSRHPPLFYHPTRMLLPSCLQQKGEGSGSGKENVPSKRSEPSRGRPVTRRGHRPEYLDREPSRESRHHGGLSVQELMSPYGTRELMDALPEIPTTEAEIPQPSDEPREQNAPPTPRLAPRLRPDTPPGQDLLTSPEASGGDEASYAPAPVYPSNNPADFQRWADERDWERNRMHRRRIRKRYPRPQLPSTVADTTSASGTGESRRPAISSEAILAALPRKPFSYQRMT